MTAATETATILCIDDDLYSLALVRTILTHRQRFLVLTAANGRGGLELAAERLPHLILLDIDLPDLHGSEVAERLARDERTRSIPVIAISATSDPSPSWFDGVGVRAFVRKPIEDVRGFMDLIQATVAA